MNKNEKKFYERNYRMNKSSEKGITLIALVVTIIVLLILAGVAIAMLRGDNGILNRGSEAKFANTVASFDEQTKLAAMSVRTSIESNKVSKAGYIATAEETVGSEQVATNLKALADEVATGLGVTAVKGSSTNTIIREGYTVAYYLDNPGSSTANGHGYIVIWYTDNSLRSTMDKVETLRYGLENSTDNNVNVNEAVITCIIHVQNYNSEMSEKYITSITTAGKDIEKEHYGDTSLNGKTSTIFSTAESSSNNSGNNNSGNNSGNNNSGNNSSTVTRASLTPAPSGSKYNAGDVVTLGGEDFFVLSDDGTHVTLLAKYCLNRAGTAQAPATATWDGSGDAGYGRSFSSTNYWNGKSGVSYPCDLQTEERLGWMTDAENVSNNAIKAAQAYGTAKGVTGKLMTYDDANAIVSASTSGKTDAEIAQINKMRKILCGTWTSSDGLGDAPANGWLLWWLGAASITSVVWTVYGFNSDLYSSDYYSIGSRGPPSFIYLVVLHLWSERSERSWVRSPLKEAAPAIIKLK